MATTESPDRTILVDWYELAGGGGAGWSEDQVRLRPSDERFRTGSDCVFRAASADRLSIRWKDSRSLEIAYPHQDSVLKSESRWRNVSISYREDPALRRHPTAVP